MEQLAQRQIELQGRISRAFDNLKKLGTANITKGAIQTRLDSLNDNWKKFEGQHDKLLELVTKETATSDYFANDVFATTEETYLLQRTRFTDLMSQYVSREAAKSTTSTDTTASSSKSRLTHIEVPHFSGSYQAWGHFKELFISLVIKDASLTNVERMHYLMNALTDEPAEMLQGLPITGENFAGAWKQLTARYDNKRALVNAQFNALAALKPMSADTAQELKRVFHGTQRTVNALEALERPIDDGTDWLVHSTVDRLSTDTIREWELSLNGSTEPPSYENLKEFLQNHIRTLEAIEAKTRRVHPRPAPKPTSHLPLKSARAHQVTKKESSKGHCSLCHGGHYILFCEALLNRSPLERRELIAARQLCLNCLGKHNLSDCRSEKRCQQCLGRHHSILHGSFQNQGLSELRTSNVAELQKGRTEQVILATAQVLASTHQGTQVLVRALIDQGSEVSLITENLAQLLRLPRQMTNMVISGVGADKPHRIKSKVSLMITSIVEPNFHLPISALVLPQLTNYKPHVLLGATVWKHTEGLELADPDFDSPDRLDLILGADVYCDIIQDGLRRGGTNTPIAQRTALGWILSGKVAPYASQTEPPVSRATVRHCCESDLLPLMRRFWEQEELPARPLGLTVEESHCEEHFVTTHQRASDGRYIVRLPLKGSPPQFLNSRALAVKMQLNMERRFLKDDDFADLYRRFMAEYESLGHMEDLTEDGDKGNAPEYFLPHHGVLKESSTTTRLRVVFNGSQAASDGHSLNNFLCTGPNLLPELAAILLRWRVHKYVFSADIEKMYRQIWVHPDDRRLQRIVWRALPGERLRTFQLKTVTYGLSCAPFLAIRTLQQLAADEERSYPLGAATLRSNCYVDDILTGDASLPAAKQRQAELIGLCLAGGFTLSKWAANTQELLPADIGKESVDKHFAWPEEEGRMILGITWKPMEDAFTYRVTGTTSPHMTTKRAVLSRISKLFDSLGWVAPITITAKVFMQSLWLLALDWDTPLPPSEERHWAKIVEGLPALSQISIPRWMHLDVKDATIEIHGFADASERAKAAVVYLRVITGASQVTTSLVMSKTKVAALKPECIARKELCAAKMLTELVTYVRRTLNLEMAPIHLWSDSKVALAWIQGHPRKWTQYVANRVADIQTMLPQAMWHHVDGGDNPADCASRGLTPAQLRNFQLWWQGPACLSATTAPWRGSNAYAETELELRKTVATTTVKQEAQIWPLLHRFSSLTKLLRITAWCQRWIGNCLGRNRETAPGLTTVELNRARLRWITIVQRASYGSEFEQLRRGNAVSSTSRLSKLNPFVDKDGVLRVGGRLKHSLLSYEEKHPLILPPDSQLTMLVIDATHRTTLHGVVQLTLGTIRRSYWIPRGRTLVRQWIHKCVRCTRWRAATIQQQMGNLPSARITPSRPFLNSGLDYAGPILLRTSKGRGHKSHKGYIAIFVCFSTRAVHLEAVSDYTTSAFLAAFRRFVSRRGICATLTSDCGSNFVGAATELRNLLGAATSENKQLAAALANDGTQWRFNPPGAPHFGGLWEAAVNSTKFHLRRVIGDTTLTFEEMTTFLAQVEACLN